MKGTVTPCSIFFFYQGIFGSNTNLVMERECLGTQFN